MSTKSLDSKKNSKRYDNPLHLQLNVSNNSNRSCEEKKNGIKDKIKNFVFEMDGNIKGSKGLKGGDSFSYDTKNSLSTKRSNFSNKSNDVYNRILSGTEVRNNVMVPNSNSGNLGGKSISGNYNSSNSTNLIYSYNSHSPTREENKKQSNYLNFKNNNFGSNKYNSVNNANSEFGIKSSKNKLEGNYLKKYFKILLVELIFYLIFNHPP